MFKKSMLILSIIITVIIIILGHRAWVNSQKDIHRLSPTVVESTSESVESTDSEESTDNNSEEDTGLSALIANQPEHVQEIWLNSQETDEPVDIAIIATESSLLLDENWTTLLQEGLTSNYSGVVLNYSIIPYEGTSEDQLTSLDEGSISLEDQDIVLYELPTIHDGGVLSIDDQVYYTRLFLEEFQTSYPDSALFAFPSQPFQNATYYPEMVEAVRETVEENNIPYLNHWTDWPSTDDPELENYLTEDDEPTELGHTTWGTNLVNYFSSN
ncbi:hypothetical protein [Jeotgalibacillus proteolyticus]|uniref:SGNH/GDSL hydrolase family protein n=1 Tax=Jeotgalibacillus proteolyticus TaxID=2082395 RepID=A0A2S5GBC2_9BACL|nr:hypothetical protein [Jeotgalibacillus proteolyticus]PPA70296.1 hypothetical protein C4B60_12005 [Jeotgalibacillus proteolyticus]